MLATGALLFLLAATPGGSARVEGFTTPEPTMLEELRRRHRPGQVLRVTSGKERYEWRAQDLDPRGLEGLTPRGRSPVPSDPYPWSRIERIDILTTRTTYGRVMGFVMGGLAGMILPAFPNGYSTQKPHQVRDYFFAGALVGGLAGGYLGSQNIREKPLYVAPAMPAAPVAPKVSAPAMAVTDSATTRSMPDAADTTRVPSIATTPGSSAFDAAGNPEVRRALSRINSGSLLRIDGAFGRYYGYASQASTSGLSGLRAEPTLQAVNGVRALRWDEIQRIDARGGSAGQGAIRGAVLVGGTVGLLGALLGAAIDSYSGSSTYGTGSAALAGGAIGAGIGGAVGALFGAAIGAGVPSWHTVYSRY